MEKESTDNLLVNNRASKKKQQPKFLFDGREYRDDSKLKAYLKKERKAKEVILAREKRPADELFSPAPTPYLYLCNFGAGSQPKLNQEEVDKFFQKIEGFQRIEREKSKPWVLVVFDSSESASNVVNRFHGHFCENCFERYFIFFYALEGPGQTEYGTKNSPSLFGEFIKGLKLANEFITTDEETGLLSSILSEGEWESVNGSRVKHWGYKFETHTKLLSDAVPRIPAYFQSFIDRMVQSGLVPFVPDQLTVTCSEPGHGIASQVEIHSAFEDGVLTLSLQSQILFEMRHPNGEIVEVLLLPRSLLLLSGEARYLWAHCIDGRLVDHVGDNLIERGHRVSVTFRKARGRPCTCSYYAQCDTMLFSTQSMQSSKTNTNDALQGVKPAMPEEERSNSRIEETFVKDVYDSIATHFSDTRHSPWPIIDQFLKALPDNALVCDVGCGNGKYFNSNPNVCLVGTDQSTALLHIAKVKGRDVVACNCLTLPFKSQLFDVVISIAVIHHFSTEKHRLRALKEIVRVIKPGGKLLIYVWAMEQEKRKFGQQDVMVPWNMDEKRLAKLIQEKGESEDGLKIQSLVNQAEKKDNYVVFQRYYHVFKQGELSGLLHQIPGLIVHPETYDQENWTVIAERMTEENKF